MKKEYLFGDMFLLENYIFRIYNNSHTKDKVIAYPIYQVKNNFLSKDFSRDKIIKKYSQKIGKNNFIPLILKSKIEEYYPCLNVKESKDQFYFDYLLLKNKLNKIGISKVGLTGSCQLKLRGYSIKNTHSDLDLIIVGKYNCLKLKNNLDKIYDKNFVSYENKVKKIYLRRKLKSSPFFIDYKTAKEFESKKPIGILHKRLHINITPTEKDKDFICLKNQNNLGIITTNMEIIDSKNGYSVPGFYKVSSKYKNYFISELRSNLFFYLLGAKKGDRFKVKGRLIKSKNKYFLELDSRGEYKEYFMNKI